MPTRTEIVITIGEVLECIPPGKYRRKRYNSFDANRSAEAENDENIAPAECATTDMKPGKLTDKDLNGDISPEPALVSVRRKTRSTSVESGERPPGRTRSGSRPYDDDEEVTFHPASVTENGEPYANGADDSGLCGKIKSKRKSSAEKFLEDNATYFQLEVLPSKTRSNKLFEENSDSNDDDSNSHEDSEGFHNSFLNFLKSKNIEGGGGQKGGRVRHKSGPSDHCGGQTNDRVASRPRTLSCQRDDGEAKGKRRQNRDESPNSEPDSFVGRRRKKAAAPSPLVQNSSDEESDGEEEEPSLKKSTRSSIKQELQSSPGRRGRRSELDKLLEAVDTSFHFETAAEAAKRLSDSSNPSKSRDNENSLGPLEIDVESNCDSDENLNPSVKRKLSDTDCDTDTAARGRKRTKPGRGSDSESLLKTISPGGKKRASRPAEESDEEDEDSPVWDGWQSLESQLEHIDGDPVAVDSLYFSFEQTPMREGWFQTYSRQDRGDEMVFYHDSAGAPFVMPYEMPYSYFMPPKSNGQQPNETATASAKRSLQPSSAAESVKKSARPAARNSPFHSETKVDAPEETSLRSRRPAKILPKRKGSESEQSTDSEASRKGKLKFGPKSLHLQDLQPRVSPRCHASTKALLLGGPLGDDEDDYVDTLLFDEAHHPALPFTVDESSNDSGMMSVRCGGRGKTETIGEYLQIAVNLDKVLRQPDPDLVNDPALLVKESPKRSKSEAGKPAGPVTAGTRSKTAAEMHSPKGKKEKEKKKKKVESPMDQIVANAVDEVLLDCLEDELPTVPFDNAVPGSDVLELMRTYKSCDSMNLCNSRWLKPKPFLSASSKIKTDRVYKTEPQNADGAEKNCDEGSFRRSPVRMRPMPVYKEDSDTEEDSVSVSSYGSNNSRKLGKKRKINMTGFPSLKKKKKLLIKPATTKTGPTKAGARKSESPPSNKKLHHVNKVVVNIKKERLGGQQKLKQAKMEKFLTRTSKPSGPSPKKSQEAGKPSRRSDTRKEDGQKELGKRSATLKAKNYSELESDTESLFEGVSPVSKLVRGKGKPGVVVPRHGRKR